jgi:quinol monooxygenase YgiN
MVIVSGRIYVRPDSRTAFLASSAQAIVQARVAPGCRDFVVAADPLEVDRVNVYEEWETEDALLSFWGNGPDQDMASSIVRARVARHIVSSTGPA